MGVKTVRELANWKFGKWARSIVTLAKFEKEGARPADCMLNIDMALDKEHEGKSFTELLALPVSALQGLTEKADACLKHHHVDTIEKLGSWKFFAIAESMVDLVDTEETMTPEERKQAREMKKLE
ncbi:Uncharacterized protein SCF082_LOCUS19894 [Durusdinium trenchii]|uniref:Uncharacterized protein n=1 Tax=Durusdinium trenchii TaxID=1381693 RepID=A0ABP0KYN8_9DINO